MGAEDDAREDAPVFRVGQVAPAGPTEPEKERDAPEPPAIRRWGRVGRDGWLGGGWRGAGHGCGKSKSGAPRALVFPGGGRGAEGAWRRGVSLRRPAMPGLLPVDTRPGGRVYTCTMPKLTARLTCACCCRHGA